AEAHRQAARQLDPNDRDPNLACAYASQVLELAKLRAEPDALQQAVLDVVEVYRKLEHGDVQAQLATGEAVAPASGGARIQLDQGVVEMTLHVGDLLMLSSLVTVAEHGGMRDLGTRVEQRLLQRRDVRFVSGGMLAMVWGEPVSLLLARCARLAGRLDVARERFLAAIDECQAAQAKPYEAWARYQLAELLLKEGATHDTELCSSLLESAAELASRLQLGGLL